MSGSADSVAKRILNVVGGDALQNDPRFATNADRIANVDALDALISTWTSTHTWRDAVQILADAGAAAGPVALGAAALGDGDGAVLGGATFFGDAFACAGCLRIWSSCRHLAPHRLQ